MNLLSTDDIPQADILTDVIRTVVCVSQGGTSFQDIAAFIHKVERQGRYYRKAAEIIGMVATPSMNHSILTSLGNEFIRTGATLNSPLLLQGLLGAKVFQRVIPFLESRATVGVSRSEIVNFLQGLTRFGGDSMAERRFNSIIAWLVEMGLIQEFGGRYYLSVLAVNSAPEILNFSDITDPILPRGAALQDYQTVHERTTSANQTITVEIDQATRERANNAHRRLVNLVADRIKGAGAIPRYNGLIDLATSHAQQDYIFEMKSLTVDNVKSQVRRGVSQLYEYQYLQNLPDSGLVLVIEAPLSPEFRWMVDYLEINRGIKLIWDGNDQLYATDRTREEINFLGILSP